ncbi:uncharacterized protein LOC111713738 [Eurytemora carolleeae]|uniref:uncharacterized protein LOC111713738 n=1 Tax=Eurytemora carolleeae TaxID=1294199 RepID=UPI000C781C3F|nr:uncharacterized protein LOC111713738 [Eurytemora carolleeae]|eukprot:XP_023344446.1 uncharacterized protein LOC111713738 [Eurytemora affinis]
MNRKLVNDFVVDLELKNELILKKQIRQSTTRRLQRPSFFQESQRKSSQEEPISPAVLTALLDQRKQGKLSNSVLENWVSRFEREFEECHSKHSSEFRKQIQSLKKISSFAFLGFAHSLLNQCSLILLKVIKNINRMQSLSNSSYDFK